MSEALRITILGAAGRMGQMLVRQTLKTEGARLFGAAERPGHDWIGRDIGEAMGLGSALEVIVQEDPLPLIAESHAVIDFTAPAAVVEHARLCAQAKCAMVIGATGFDEAQIDAIEAASHHCPILRAGNMSLGVNLLVALTRKVAAALDTDWDIEIVESHHRHKVDAPSGTALMLGEAAAQGRGGALPDLAERGRDGITGARERGRIGFHAIRGGDVVGEHDVIFAADAERIVLRHIATDRAIFARGALKAALWTVGKRPGAYSMMDALGLGEEA